MKFEICNLKSVSLALAVLASFAAMPSVRAEEPFDSAYQKHLRVTRSWGMHTLACDAVKDMPAVLAFIDAETAKGGHARQLDALVYGALETLWRGRDVKTGAPLAERTYADKAASMRTRAMAARYLALGIVDAKRDYAAADALYAKLLETPNLNDDDFVTLVGARAHLCAMREDRAGAFACVASARAKLPAGDARRKAGLNRRLDEVEAGVYGEFFDPKGKLAFWRKKGNLMKVYLMLANGEVADTELCAETCRQIFRTFPDATSRREAWMWLWGRDERFCRENLARAFDQTEASTNAFCDALAGQLTRGIIHNAYGKTHPSFFGNFEQAAKTWELYLDYTHRLGRTAGFGPSHYATVAYAGLRRKGDAIAAAREGLTNAKLKSEERYELETMVAILSLGDKGRNKSEEGRGEGEMVEALKAAEADLAKRLGVAAKARKDRFERAGCVAILCGDDAIASAVAKFYRTCIDPTPPRKVYTVKFTDRAVAGAGDWVNLPFKPEESPFDRKFGGPGMSFMTSDVATGDRGHAVEGGEKVREFPTTLQVVADEWGVHFLYTFYDRRARRFESGELDAGSFESYIAPGDNTPYACFLCQLKKNASLGIMNTTYDMPGHRRIDPQDAKVVRSGTTYTDDAILHYTAFSWDVFAEHVPADGGTWDFESVFWGPVPSAWNGTASIHGRSTWGLLRFELGDAARVKIFRQQLFRAVNLYKGEKSPGGTFEASAQAGVLDHWQDDALGDPAFYDACLKPIVAELDAVAARVKVGMSDRDVREISEKYLSRFLNIRAEVARLRAAYLSKM